MANLINLYNEISIRITISMINRVLDIAENAPVIASLIAKLDQTPNFANIG